MTITSIEAEPGTPRISLSTSASSAPGSASALVHGTRTKGSTAGPASPPRPVERDRGSGADCDLTAPRPGRGGEDCAATAADRCGGAAGP